VIGGADSQSPKCGEDAAFNLALSISVVACDKTMASYSSAAGLSQARWMCCDSKAGFSHPDRKVHASSALAIAPSSKDCMDSGRMAC